MWVKCPHPTEPIIMESTHHEEQCVPNMGCAIISAGIMLSMVAMFVNVTKFLWSALWASIDTYWKSSMKDGQPMAQEQNNELNEEEKRIVAELRMIMEQVDKAPREGGMGAQSSPAGAAGLVRSASMSSPERIHFIAEAFEVLLECPSLLKKAPHFNKVVTQKMNEMRNKARIIYRSSKDLFSSNGEGCGDGTSPHRVPIGITINDELHRGEEHIVAARRMFDMIDRLDRVMNQNAE